jgi:FkbM family methyltransferase
MLIKIHTLCEKYHFIPKGVIHLGAHLGEEAAQYDKLGIHHVLWVEGNPMIFEKLKENLKPYPSNRALNALVSEDDQQEIEFQIANDSQASSIFTLGSSKVHHPDIHMTKSIRLKTRRIDQLFEEEHIPIDQYNFLNIDLQGAELLAMKGMGELLYKIDHIYLEVNLARIYSGNPKLADIDRFLAAYGFRRMETAITKWQWGDAYYQRIGISKAQLIASVADARLRELTSQFSYLKNWGRNALREVILNSATLRKIFSQFSARVRRAVSDVNYNGEKYMLENVFGQNDGKVIIFDIGADNGAYTEMAVNTAAQHQQPYEIHLFESPQQPAGDHFRTNPSVHINPSSPGMQLERYIQEKGTIHHISMLKIAAGGETMNVLHGCGDHLNPALISTIQFEYGAAYKSSDISLKEAFELLTRVGYKVGRLHPNKVQYIGYSPSLEQSEYSNFIAVAE